MDNYFLLDFVSISVLLLITFIIYKTFLTLPVFLELIIPYKAA